MEAIKTMKRYEIKYILSREQISYLVSALQGHMEVDQYGKTSIASIYFDTPDDRLIRTSIEKPTFKEKIRARSYGLAKPNQPVFLELKRKADGIVYKRRVQIKEEDLPSFFESAQKVDRNDQIGKEILYFKT